MKQSGSFLDEETHITYGLPVLHVGELVFAQDECRVFGVVGDGTGH
ncbi:MAG: hypothetical protein RL429_605, partial [Bacteroidota bacterium]